MVTGASGQLGGAVRDLMVASSEIDDIFCPSSSDLDLEDVNQVRECIGDIKPEFLINCAAWTDVDGAEEFPDKAFNINGRAPLAMARALIEQRSGILIQVSTDYVFDGGAESPYSEDAQTRPLSVYGATKLLGESVLRAAGSHCVAVRTAWLYSERRDNFLLRVLEALDSEQEIQVVRDQFGHPTWSRDAAARIVEIANGLRIGRVPVGGVFHAVNSGLASRYELVREAIRLTDRNERLLTGVETSDLQLRATRPPKVALGDDAARACGLAAMRSWDEALRDFLAGPIDSHS